MSRNPTMIFIKGILDDGLEDHAMMPDDDTPITCLREGDNSDLWCVGPMIAHVRTPQDGYALQWHDASMLFVTMMADGEARCWLMNDEGYVIEYAELS